MDRIDQNIEAQAALAVARREARVQMPPCISCWPSEAMRPSDWRRSRPRPSPPTWEELAEAVRSGQGAICYRVQEVNLPARYARQIGARVRAGGGAATETLAETPKKVRAA